MTKRRSAFTLIELLVVVGIIVLLIGILIPAVVRALAIAGRARTSAELSSISTALEQFRSDFHDYPRVTVNNTGAAVLGKALLALGPAFDPAPAYAAAASYSIGDVVSSSGTIYESIKGNPSPNIAPTDPTNGTTYWKIITPNVAAMYASGTVYQPGTVVNDGTGVLYVCVLSAGSDTTAPAAGVTVPWAQFNWADGAGVGQYRIRPGATAHDAYLQLDKFRSNGTDILDRNGFPILYFPASPSPHDATTGAGYIGLSLATSVFNINDNLAAFRSSAPTVETNDTNSTQRFCAMMGDLNYDGHIGMNETALAAGKPYVLWSSGVDGIFGPRSDANSPTNTQNVDDVTNFR